MYVFRIFISWGCLISKNRSKWRYANFKNRSMDSVYFLHKYFAWNIDWKIKFWKVFHFMCHCSIWGFKLLSPVLSHITCIIYVYIAIKFLRWQSNRVPHFPFSQCCIINMITVNICSTCKFAQRLSICSAITHTFRTIRQLSELKFIHRWVHSHES